jgi:hypothetical protein
MGRRAVSNPAAMRDGHPARKAKTPALPVQNGCLLFKRNRATNATSPQRGRKRLVRDVRFDVLEEALALALGFRLHRATRGAR